MEEVLKEAISHFVRKDYLNAILQFDKLIENNYKMDDAYNRRGRAKLRLGRFTEALMDFNTAICINPTFSAAYSNRAICHQRLGRYSEEMEDYDKAILLAEHCTIKELGTSYCNRGLTKKRIGNLGGAKRDWEKAIECGDWYAKKMYRKYFSADYSSVNPSNEDAHKDYRHLHDGYGGYIDSQLVNSGLGGEDEAYWNID